MGEPVIAVAVDLDDFVVNTRGRGQGWANDQLIKVTDIIERSAYTFEVADWHHVPPDEWVIMLGGATVAGLHERALSCASALKFEIRDATELTASIGISRPYFETESRAKADRQAHVILANKLVRNGDCILQGPQSNQVLKSPPRIDRELARYVQAGDRTAVARILTEWIDLCASLFGVSSSQLQEWVIGQLLFVMDLVCGRRTSTGSADWTDKRANIQLIDLLRIADIHERSYLRLWVSDTVRQIVPAPDAPTRPSEMLLRSAESYIFANMTDPSLTLSKLAGQMFASPHHLAHLFRSERNTTFLGFLTGLRMQAARHLLDTTDHSIEDISRMSGYAGTRQFRATFKRQVGSTPTDYRRDPVALVTREATFS